MEGDQSFFIGWQGWWASWAGWEVSLVEVFSLDVAGGLLLVPVVEQLFLAVQQLLLCLHAELKVGVLDHGIQRAGFLAEAAVDGLGRLDVVGGLVAAIGRAPVSPEW